MSVTTCCGDSASRRVTELDQHRGVSKSQLFLKRLELARSGNSDAVGELFNGCRTYLLKVANASISSNLRCKVDEHDLVQDTFAQAHRMFERFEGSSKEELLRWLRQILKFKIGNAFKRYCGTSRRDPKREISLASSPELVNPKHLGSQPVMSPSGIMRRSEAIRDVREALKLLSHDYRRIIEFRIDSRLSFEEIGKQTSRSPDAARKMFARGILQLKSLINSDSH